MKNFIDNYKENGKSFVALLLLIVMFVGATYAFFVTTDAEDTSFNTMISTNTVDSLVFETGGSINLKIKLEDFKRGMGNQKGETFLRATLKANNKTNQANANYFVYLDIKENEFEYTKYEEIDMGDYSYYMSVPELLLRITAPNGDEVTELGDGMMTQTVIDGQGNEITGFDVTDLTDRLIIAENYEIKSTGTEVQTWNFEVMFVNLDTNQVANVGKNFNAELTIKKEEPNTLKRVGWDEEDAIWGYKESIKSIVFEDSMNPYSDAEESFDISLAQDESVMAYMLKK